MNIQNAPQRPRVIVSLLLGLCTSLTPALASIVTTELTGNTRYDGWEGLNNSYYAPADHGSGYPGTSPWNEPMVATLGSATAEFMKISGSGFPATASMYSAAGGTFSVSGASPLADVETVVFSISIGAGTTEDVVAGPSLTLNGGATSIGAATHTWDLGSQQATIGGFEVTQTTYS
ncbi:MAG: hypothetical protein PF795_04720 [Kiritimatiellae bacterium]|jgi:hypothetical protein|nr:hypothetical protein [Kiritimatiellia bacterium]